MKSKALTKLSDRDIQFGTVLKRILKERKITQARLSKMTDISTALIYKYCNNKSQPSGYNFLKITDALQISPDEFYPHFYQRLVSDAGIEPPAIESIWEDKEGFNDAIIREIEYWQSKYYATGQGKKKNHDYEITDLERDILVKYELLDMESKMEVNKILNKDMEATFKKGEKLEKQERFLRKGLKTINEKQKYDIYIKTNKFLEKLGKAMKTLTVSEGILVELHYYSGMTLDQISSIMNLSRDETNAVYRNLIKKLRKELNK